MYNTEITDGGTGLCAVNVQHFETTDAGTGLCAVNLQL